MSYMYGVASFTGFSKFRPREIAHVPDHANKLRFNQTTKIVFYLSGETELNVIATNGIKLNANMKKQRRVGNSRAARVCYFGVLEKDQK